MAKRKKAEGADREAGKDQATHQGATAPPAAEDGPRPKRTNRQMIQAALDAGYEMPSEALPWIKEQFGVDMPLGSFSVEKSKIKKAASGDGTGGKGRGRSSRGRRQGKRRETEPRPAQSPPPARSLSPSEAAKQVKALVEQLGKDEVKGLAVGPDRELARIASICR